MDLAFFPPLIGKKPIQSVCLPVPVLWPLLLAVFALHCNMHTRYCSQAAPQLNHWISVVFFDVYQQAHKGWQRRQCYGKVTQES